MSDSVENSEVQTFSEKAKLRFEHKLKIRQILLDKALSGVIIILLGITANIVLEQYKADLTKEKFILDHKYTAIIEIKAAISEVFSNFEKFTTVDKNYTVPENYKTIYRDSLYDLYQVLHSSSVLLSDELGECCQYFLFVFSAFNQKDIAECREYRMFAYQLGEWINYHLGKELNLYPASYPDDHYKFEGVEAQLSFKVDSEIGVEKFLDGEYAKWKSWAKK